MTINARLGSLFNFFKPHLFQLNLFNTGTQTEDIIRNERRTTRLYLILFIISIVILGIYYSFASYTQTIIIKSPTSTEYTNLIQHESLKCPCSTIAIKYEKFIEIEVHYHELCQSDFVSDEWINHLFILYQQSWNKSNSSDFRRIGFFQFQTIRSLCQLSKDIIKDELQSFRYTDFIQLQLIPQERFQTQIDDFIKNFIEIIPKTFLRTLQFVQDTTAQSLFMTGASMTSVRPITQYRKMNEYGIIPYPGMKYTFKDNSTCVCSASTATSCMGLTTFGQDQEIVPGFQTGCYMLSALMESTLETFYNQTFIDILSNSSQHFQKLNSSNSNWKVKRLLSQMFIKFWSNSTLYEKYFQNCASKSCQYTKTQHHNFWAVILLLMGLIGGLSSALRIFTPIVIVNIWPIIWKVISRRRERATQTITVEDTPVTPMGTRMKILFQLIKRKLLELNLFQSIPHLEDETIIQQQRLQTRIYLVLLLIGLLTLTLFTSTKPYKITITEKLPSSTKFIQLYEQYPMTLDCPCSQITLEYHKFISYIKPQYHEICLSEFITPRWINLQFSKSPVRAFFTNDIRYQSQIHFQLLSTLCRIANQTIEENLESFNQTKFLTNQVLHPSSFQIQVNSIIDQFQRTVPQSYQRTLQLIQANSNINQFIVPLNSEFGSKSDENGKLSYYLVAKFNNEYYQFIRSGGIVYDCVDLNASECHLITIINRERSTIEIPGMFQTVFPLQSVLISTLECFYNDTCLSQITRLIDPVRSSTNFSTLQLSASSSDNSKHDQISTLANNLFIHSWNNQSLYESYFNQCYPLTCQYTYESRFNIIYIFTTIIGLLGGLNVALRLLIPPIVKSASQILKKRICRKRNNVESTVETTSIKPTFCDRSRLLITYIKKNMIELNLFPTIPPTQDENILRRSRRATRIYLSLLITSVFIVAVYTSLTQETVTIIVESPSKSTFSKLFDQYHPTLQCSCSRIAIKYNEFIPQLEPQFHPICSSIFVSLNWSNAMDHTSAAYKINGFYFVDNDFRIWAKHQFETVSKMCSLSKEILNSTLSVWRQSDLITSSIISPDKFKTQIEGLIDEFKRKTVNQFIQIFKLIQVTNHANQLATTDSLNWRFVINTVRPFNFSQDKLDAVNPNIAENALKVLALPKIYDENNCSCALQQNCSKLANFPFRTSDQSLKQTLPGFRIGCFLLDALFQSTFSCLYNQTCLDLMRTAIYYSKPIPAKILTHSSLSSQNITIETYLSQLFVIEWFKNISFDLYFDGCAPKSCQYSYTSKFNQIYFITTIIALFGGLKDVLHFVVSCVLKVVMKLYNRRKKNQVTPYSQQQSNIVTVNIDDKTLEVVPIPTITTVEVTQPSNQEKTKSATNRIEWIILFFLSLLVIVAITVISVVWLRDRDTKYVSTTTSITTSITITESTTTTSISKCYMTFSNHPLTYPIGFGGKSLTIADLNKDSIQDLAVTNYDDHTISVLLGNGNGTFQMQELYSTGNETYPWGITTGDFNNDRFLDLAVTLPRTNQIVIFFYIESNGSFRAVSYTFSQSIFTLNNPSAIEASDLNGDGFIDLVIGGQVTDGKFTDGKYTTSVYVVWNLDDGGQYNYISLNIPFLWNVDSIVIGDFDNDGRENDIGVCNLDGRVMIFSSINYTEIITSDFNHEDYNMYEKPQSIIRGRFNDDELDDLAVISSESDTLQVLLAYGDGTFIQQIYSTDRYPTSVARINFNNDSINDLAVLTCNQTVNIYLGRKLGIFDQNFISFDFDENNSNNECAHSLRVADFNQDGKDDLVFIDPAEQIIKVVLGTSCHEHL